MKTSSRSGRRSFSSAWRGPLALAAWLGAMVVLSGCSMVESVNPWHSKSEAPAATKAHANTLATATTNTPTGAANENDYHIQPSDMIDVTVFQEPDLKSELRVSQEGRIAFPLIGVVQIGGLTPREASQAIRDRLSKGYLMNPQVSVTVLQFTKRHFTVLGEVQKPGSYDMPDQQEVTVLQAIGMAGGYTRIANPSKVTLMRREEGKEKVFPLNAKRMASGSSGEPVVMVQPGDVITVAESRF